MEKEWFYRSGQNQDGPVSTDEIRRLIGQGIISLDDFVWKSGFPDWIRAREAKEILGDSILPPPFKTPGSSDIPEERRAGIKVAASLMFVMALLWLLISTLQMLASIEDETGLVAFDAAWNLVWAVALFAIGVGLWKQRTWAFNWAIGSAVLGIIWYAIQYFNGTSIMLFFAVIEVAVLALLFINRRFFQEQKHLTN
jgi:hypothetical protein